MFKLYFPYSGQLETVRCFDDDMLLNQLGEAIGLCQALHEAGGGSKLLCVRQWRGYEGFVLLHLRRLQTEVMLRDLEYWDVNDIYSPYLLAWRRLTKKGIHQAPRPPRWIGGLWFLHSNRSELIRVRPEVYAQQFPTTPLEMPFLWPQNIPGHFDYYIDMSLGDRMAVTDRKYVIPEQFAEYVYAKEKMA